jgi:hypothetical protein
MEEASWKIMFRDIREKPSMNIQDIDGTRRLAWLWQFI